MSAPYPIRVVRPRPPFRSVAKNQIHYASIIEDEIAKKERIIDELSGVGVKKFGHTRAEGRELYKLLHNDEHIMGIAYGHYAKGFALLVATNKRVLFLDKKFMFIEVDELGYELVGGVTYLQSGLFGTVILHTRIGNYKIRTMNLASTRKFINYIESRCLEEEGNDGGSHG